MQQLHQFSFSANFARIALISCQLAALVSSGHEYLREKPSFLQTCQLHDANNGECLANAFENLFSNWRSGVPGLKGLSSIDPFHVKRVRLSQQTPNLADIKAELTNVTVYGMSDTKVLKTSVNDKDYTIEFKLLSPAVHMDGDYKVQGRILILNLNGAGKIESNVGNIEFRVTCKANLIQIDGIYFLDIIAASSYIDKVGSFKIHFSNLFGDNKELEDSAHDLFNNNWRELFEIMRPAFAQTFNTILLDRYKKIMRYVPASYFLDDLP
ncbi:circadian clock-controlled protein daywake-like [Rhagoletis pomonella]|uniref:circadian clock-controlled protein daywake-like n=1 Tax=Rhagoletis pomonella TaxID=28610 RepID=UPI0017805CE1|nr:circadian clock-controlled protein daywake-like [Rhagoletis pomonella]